MEIIQIRDIGNLARLAAVGSGIHTFIQLRGGFRSSKFISFQSGRFYIFHEIDGSEQWLLPKNFGRAGLLIDAINTGNCFAELD